MTYDEIEKLSAKEVMEKEKSCMEANAWKVAEDLARRIDDEPGPAGDFMKCYVTQLPKMQFFFNRSYVLKYTAAKTDKKKQEIPGYNYIKKIYTFINDHFVIGEMFLEYLKGFMFKEIYTSRNML